MSSLPKDHHIELVVSGLPSGGLLVRTTLVRISPRVGPVAVSHFPSARFADFPYEAGMAYLAKRIRNAVAGATQEPTL